MPTIYRHKRPQPPRKNELQWPKDNSYLKKRLDQTVEFERE